MAAIKDIKKLREQSGAPVMECKKALEKAGGDFKKAKGLLKKWGLARAEKKKDRETCQGRIFAYIHHGGRIGAMVEIESETDFVAENGLFKKFGHEIAMQIASMKPKNVKVLLGQQYIREPKKKVKDLLDEVIAKIGENIVIKRLERFEVGETG